MVRHERPTSAPGAAKYEITAGSDKKQVAKGAYDLNKRYRFRFRTGVIYGAAETTTIRDQAVPAADVVAAGAECPPVKPVEGSKVTVTRTHDTSATTASGIKTETVLGPTRKVEDPDPFGLKPTLGVSIYPTGNDIRSTGLSSFGIYVGSTMPDPQENLLAGFSFLFDGAELVGGLHSHRDVAEGTVQANDDPIAEWSFSWFAGVTADVGVLAKLAGFPGALAALVSR